jgi:signal peptidase I
MMLLLIGVLFILGTYLTTALALRLGAKWARVPNVRFGRALGAALLIGLVAIVVGAVFRSPALADLPPLAVVAVQTGTIAFGGWLVVKTLFRTTWPRAILSWLPSFGVSVAVSAFVYLVLKPYVTEAFITTTHAMAPSLRGPHKQVRCPRCGQTATVFHSPDSKRQFPGERPEPLIGMCDSCQQGGEVTDPAPTARVGDRFMVNKLLAPRRWDLVSFRSLHDPNDRYVKRLVGLPGEEVVIKDGHIWINGAKQEPPPDIAKLTFLADPQGFGAPENPVRLGADECFVLGDFALRSSDSRRWGPIPSKNIEGVVSVIYFPLDRLRILR